MKTLMDFYLYTRLEQGCLAILIYIALSFFSVKRRKTYIHKLFSTIIVASIVNLILDMTTVFTVNHLESIPPLVNHFLHVLFVGSVATVVFCTYLYVRSLIYPNIQRPLGKPLSFIPFFLSILCITLLPIRYDRAEHTNYSAGFAVTAAYICIIFYFVRSLMLLAMFRRTINKKKRRGIVTALIAILIVTLIQGIVHESLISSIGITMLNLAFFFTMENPDATLVEELEYARNKADEANKAKSHFLANMSHEIRTPINAVLGMDEMILRESSEEPVIAYAENIQNAGHTLLSIVNDILDFSKVEEGKMEILPTQYELGTVINDLMNMVRSRAERKGLHLEVSANEDTPHLLFGDEIRIKQCILNILTNSVKYTEKGTVKLTVDFEKKDKSTIRLKIKVSDTGIGIKEEDIAKLFLPFKRLEESRNRTIEGAGLGITITQNLLSLMGSELRVQSVYGQGSEFSFDIEQKVIQWEPIGDLVHTDANAKTHPKQYHESFHAPQAHILVVDDMELNLTVFKSLLKKTKVNIDTATSGKEAIQKLTQGTYDLLFLDHLMPEMDGIQTFHEIKKIPTLPPQFPCIILTANAISGAREMFMAEGFTDYLSKPVSGNELESMLLQHLPKEKIITKSDSDFVPDEDSHATDASAEDRKTLQTLNNIGQRVFGIQLSDALTNCGGYEFFYDVISDFHSVIQDKAELISLYAKEQNFKNYTILVHALKSSARIIGAMQLHEEAKYLEACGNAENAEEIAAKTPALLEHYKKYAVSLTPLLGIHVSDTADKKQISERELADAFSGIKECAEAGDLQSIQNILDMLEEFAIPESHAEQYIRIKAKVSKRDFAGIMEMMKEA